MATGTLYITTEGATLAAKTLESTTLEFSKFSMGNGELTDTDADTIKALTDLINPILDFDITKISRDSDTQVTIRGLFLNTDASDSFYFRELGLYAIDSDTGDEILFAYINYGDEAEYINNSVSEKKEHYFELVINVDNADNVTVTVDSTAVYITEKDLEGMSESIETNATAISENALRCETITLSVDNWTQNADTEYYEYDVEDEDVTANHLVEGRMDLDNQAKMTDGYIESYDGGYKIITSECPEEDITINISKQKSVTEEEN